ncbi:hypothetical protein [Rhizobium helianthi]
MSPELAEILTSESFSRDEVTPSYIDIAHTFALDGASMRFAYVWLRPPGLQPAQR